MLRANMTVHMEFRAIAGIFKADITLSERMYKKFRFTKQFSKAGSSRCDFRINSSTQIFLRVTASLHGKKRVKGGGKGDKKTTRIWLNVFCSTRVSVSRTHNLCLLLRSYIGEDFLSGPRNAGPTKHATGISNSDLIFSKWAVQFPSYLTISKKKKFTTMEKLAPSRKEGGLTYAARIREYKYGAFHLIVWRIL